MQPPKAMRTLTIAARKGGIGKSATSVTTSQHAALNRGLRTLHIDVDGQGNSSNTLEKGGFAVVSAITSDQLFTQNGITVESAHFVVIQANDPELRKLEREGDKRNEFASNFIRNIESLADQFDICVIDTPPSVDVRLLSALVASSAVISPLELNQECVDGVGPLLSDPQTGINAIKSPGYNPTLDFLGFLPSMVGPSDFQQSNLAAMLTGIGPFMFIHSEGKSGMLIPRSIAVPEAMASGVPVFKSGKDIKSTGAKYWAKVKPVFDEIVDRTLNSEGRP